MSFLDLIARSERETLKFRLLAILAVAVAILFQAEPVSLFGTFALVGGYLIFTYALRVYLIPMFLSYTLAGIMLLADAITLLASLYILGLNSPTFALLPIAVVYHSIYLGYAGGLIMAVLFTLGYVGLAFVTDQSSALSNVLAVQAPAFYILALLAGYITKQRAREVEERRSLQQLIDVETNAKVLLDLTQSLQRATDIKDLSQDVARMGALAARMPYCLVFFFDEDAKGPVFFTSNVDLSELTARKGTRVAQAAPPNTLIGRAWQDGSPSSFSMGSGDGGGLLPGWLADLKPARGLAVPMYYQGDSLGVLCALDPQGSNVEEDTVATVQSFSQAAGGILGRVQVYSEAEKRSSRVVANLRHSIDSAGRLREQGRKRVLRFGSLVVDPGRELIRTSEKQVQLTRTEFDLLYVLAENSGALINQETLLREVWGKDFVPQGKVVDVTIHRIRKKLAAIPDGRELINTVRGQGYTFSPSRRYLTEN